MKRRHRDGSGSARLRRRAEALLRQTPHAIAKPVVAETSELVHELRIHQAELEMQNDELQRAQLEIEASRDRFAELFDFAPAGYLTVDSEGIIRESNLAAADIVGVTRDDLARHKFSHFIAAESQDTYYLHRQKVFATKNKQNCELILRRPDGTACSVELQSVLTTALPSGRRQCLTVLSDITLRKNAETTRAMLAAIVETSEDAIISKTRDCKITSWNGGAKRLYGYCEEEVIGRSVRIIIPPECHKELEQIQQRILRGERIEQFETIRRRKDGRIIQVSVAISPIRDGAGRVTGASAIARDITQQKQLEEAMREREQAQALVDFFVDSPLGLLFANPRGFVERVNPALLMMIGRTVGNVVNKNVSAWFVTPKRAAELLGQLHGKSTVRNFRARLRHANGSILDVLIDANGMWRKDTLLYSRWFVRDITERVQLERELQVAVENEQRRFGQDLHDDLCQQLAGVEFLCQRLVHEQANDFGGVKNRVLEIAKLVRDSMDHARELARGLMPIATDGESLMFALDKLAGRTRTIFRCDCRFRRNPPVVLANRVASSHLYRIAQEAVNNSIRHSKASRIEISLISANGEIVLKIKDNGTGLPQNLGTRQGMGLRIMNHRAGTIGASLVVRRRASGGTEVVCVMQQGGRDSLETDP